MTHLQNKSPHSIPLPTVPKCMTCNKVVDRILITQSPMGENYLCFRVECHDETEVLDGVHIETWQHYVQKGKYPLIFNECFVPREKRKTMGEWL